ncbi:MAG TPA: cupin domain-containing protein [Gemmatimonadaceae bacterium]
MHVIRQEDLPFVGMSHQFIGAEQADVGISVYLVNAPPGRGAPPHRHPYDEIAFIREGHVRWTVDGESRDGTAGDILVVKAGQIHSFTNIGDTPLIQLDVHVNPRFVQENIKP